jgi:hypothetical protein
MNQAIKALWLAALRSGLTQIRDTMHRQRTLAGEYCPWGLLCELHRQEVDGIWRGPDGRGAFAYLGNFDGPPQAVWDWAGLPEQLPINIIDLNRHLTFAEIAAQIEAHL